MDEGQTNNPNVSPSYPMKFRGLLAMVTPIPHITQQNSLIGSSSKIKPFHVMILFSISQSLYDFSNKILNTHTPYMYMHVMHVTFLWKNLQAYNIGDSI